VSFTSKAASSKVKPVAVREALTEVDQFLIFLLEDRDKISILAHVQPL
jgi:hypothetical protein